MKGINTNLKDWQGWLKLVSGVIIFTVGISCLGSLSSILIPISFTLWRQSLV